MSGFGALSNISTAVSGIASNGGSIIGTVGSILDGSWLSELLPCTYRGLTFNILAEEPEFGRRTAMHEYAFRDEVWGEDIGRAPRIFELVGFVIGDDCHAQAKALIAAAEQGGKPGQLVHPWLGTRTVALAGPVRQSTRLEKGRVVEVRFRFVETTDPIYPSAAVATQSASAFSAISSLVSSVSSFASKISGFVSLGATVFNAGVNTIQGFSERAYNLTADSKLLVSAIAGLPPDQGLFYGRYANGARGSLLSGVTTSDGAIAAVASARLFVLQAGTACINDAASYALATTALPADLQSLTDAVRATCNDPSDAVRLLVDLSGYAPATLGSSSVSTVQNAMAALARQSALSGLALACADYVPTSADDARNVLATVLPQFDAECQLAADQGYGEEYLALRRLRAAVAADLYARGTQLPSLIEVDTMEPQPALTLAYRLYGDASRADELTARSSAVASLFLPTSFEALAA